MGGVLAEAADVSGQSVPAEVSFSVHRSPAPFAVERLQRYLKGGPQPANKLANREVVLVLPLDGKRLCENYERLVL